LRPAEEARAPVRHNPQFTEKYGLFMCDYAGIGRPDILQGSPMKRSALRKIMTTTAISALVFTTCLMSVQAAPTAAAGASAEHARIVGHWTPARVAAAIPRDLVIDERGQGYLKKPDGSLEPYGQAVAGGRMPAAKPVGGDTQGPDVGATDPANGAVIGTSYTFKAAVTDASKLRSVSFKISRAGGMAQSFTASLTSNNVYAVSLQGFTAGDWSWYVVAKDAANNTTTTGATSFTVSTSGGGGGGGGGTNVVTNSEWTYGGTVQTAAGRIYFEMPSNSRKTRWAGYVCSGTVATDGTPGRSVIQTAAHCVYDDAYKAFARNVLFIPNQAGGGSGTDLNCSNDPLGCWTPAFGVVDNNWTTRTFPDNVAWDYAYYVVPDGAHEGAGENGALDALAGSLPINFGVPLFEISGSGDYTHALGYSYSDDPNFMYCAEDLTQLDSANWWLGSCGLSGGSSGGPWAQPMNPDTGVGPIISVNSWGYTNQPGMAGPKLWGNSASCVFSLAKNGDLTGTEVDGAGLKFSGTCP
jgi:hypothetical protein